MMHRLPKQQRLVALAFVAATVVAPALATPLRAQTPGASSAGQTAFKVLIVDLVNKTDPKATRFGVKTSTLIRQSIGQMATHTPVATTVVVAELKKLSVLADNFDCTTARQLGARPGPAAAQVIMCGDFQTDAAGYKVSASFFTKEEAISYDVLPFTATTEAEAATRIATEFKTYVKQLQLVTFCQQSVQSEQWQEALNQCTAALELNPKSTPSLYYRATALLKLGKPDEALEGYQKVLEISPINQEAMRSAGSVAAQLGKSELAAKYFHDYLELNPGDEGVRLTLANDLNKNGDPVAAAKFLEEGLKGDTTNYAMMGAIGNYWMVAASNNAKSTASDAQKAASKEQFANALKYYDRISMNLTNAKVDPRGLDDLYRYMMTAYLQTDQKAKAVALGTAAMTNDSLSSGTLMVYATALGTTGKQAEAIAALNRAAVKDPTLKVSYQMSLLALASGNLNDIVSFAKKAAAEGATNAQIDQIAIQLVSEGAKKSGSEMSAWLNAGKELAKSDKPVAMANFYQGKSLFEQGTSYIPKKPKVITKSGARAAIPLLERSRSLIGGSSAFTEGASARASYLNSIGATLAYLNQVIKAQ